MPAQRAAGTGLFIGRIFGIPVYVGPSWFVVAGLLTVVYQPWVLSRVADISSAGAYLVAFGFAVLLYGSVLVHELGHSLVARSLRLPVDRITIQALVGLSHIEREPETPGREFLVAAAGPATSLALAAVGVLAARLTAAGTVTHVVVAALAFSNAVVGVLNLLPGLPLDGGRVLRAAVWRLCRDPNRATRAAAWSGRVMAVVLVGIGLATSVGRSQFDGGYQLVVFLLVAGFVWAGATATLRAAGVREVLPRLHAGALSRPALTVTGDTPLAEALRRLVEQGARAIVVVDGAGRPTGIVSERAVSATPPARRPWVAVAALARSLEPGLVLDPGLEGSDLLQALRRTPAEEYLVAAGPDLRGVLAAADVAGLFAGRPA